METKRTFLLIAAFFAFILLWQAGTNWFARSQGWNLDIAQETPADVDAVDGEAATTRPGDGATVGAATRPATRPDTAGNTQQEGLHVQAGEPRELVLGDGDPDGPYAMRVVVDTVGAGLNGVTLNRYTAEVGDDAPYAFELPYDENPETKPLATREVVVNGKPFDLGSVAWKVDEGNTDADSARLYVDLYDGETRVAQVRKLIELSPRQTADGEDDPTGGYELLVRQTVDNLTGGEATVQLDFNGTTTPPRELERGMDRTVLRGLLGEGGRVRYEAEQVESFDDDEPSRTYDAAAAPLAWAGTGTIYFNAIVRPEEPSQISKVVADAINPTSDPVDRHVALRFESAESTLAAGERLTLPARVFLGPKRRDLLDTPYYSAPGVRYDSTLISPFGCTWCVFQPVVDILVALLSVFHLVLRDWGLAIIALVILVRTCLHPITRKAQKNMMRMSKLAPKIQAAKEKYGDDKEKMAQAMSEIAPEQAQALLFGCLPMMLQTPIWIALYSTLQATFELRHEPFLFGWTWIDDLARPDGLIEFGRSVQIIPFVPGIHGINLLPILMGVVFYVQMKLQPQPTATMTDEQKSQQKMIQVVMVALFPLFLYSAPSGLVLYILTSTTIGIIETKIIRRNLRLEEEAEEAQRLEDERLGRKPEPKPKSGLAKKFDDVKATLARRMEEVQRQAAQQQSGGGKGGRK